MRPTKHLAFQHLQAIDMAFDGAVTPWDSHPSFDRRIVVAEPLRKTPQGLHRTARGAREPAIQALRLPGAHQVRKVPDQRDGLREFRLLRDQLGQLLFLVRSPGLRPPQHEPGGPPRREVAVLGFRDDRERVGRRGWLAGRQPLRLPEALGIAGYSGIAALVALLLEAMKELQGVMAPLVPVLEDGDFVGVQDTVPPTFIGPLRKGGAAEIPKHGTLANPQLLRNSLPGPALTTQRPDLLMARQPSAPAMSGLHLCVAGRGRAVPGRRPSHQAVCVGSDRSPHWRPGTRSYGD